MQWVEVSLEDCDGVVVVKNELDGKYYKLQKWSDHIEKFAYLEDVEKG